MKRYSWRDTLTVSLVSLKTGGKQTGGNDISVATGMTVQCRRDAMCSIMCWQAIVARNLVVLQQGGRICVTLRLPV